MNLERDTNNYGILSAVAGTVSMVLWLIPGLGMVTSVAAIYTGTRAVNNNEEGWPLAGIALGAVAVVLTLLRSGLVYYYG